MIIDNDFIRIGVIIGAHALNGRLKVFVTTDIIERFSKGNVIYLHEDDSYKAYTIAGFSQLKGSVGLVSLEGVDSRTEAERLKKVEVFIKRSVAEATKKTFLEHDTFYYYELIDCQVFYEDQYYGDVVDILQAGSGEILIIKNNNNKEVMVPFVKEMVDTQEITNKRIDIYPVEGLLDI